MIAMKAYEKSAEHWNWLHGLHSLGGEQYVLQIVDDPRRASCFMRQIASAQIGSDAARVTLIEGQNRRPSTLRRGKTTRWSFSSCAAIWR
jgi:hypothetical protein